MVVAAFHSRLEEVQTHANGRQPACTTLYSTQPLLHYLPVRALASTYSRTQCNYTHEFALSSRHRTPPLQLCPCTRRTIKEYILIGSTDWCPPQSQASQRRAYQPCFLMPNGAIDNQVYYPRTTKSFGYTIAGLHGGNTYDDSRDIYYKTLPQYFLMTTNMKYNEANIKRIQTYMRNTEKYDGVCNDPDADVENWRSHWDIGSAGRVGRMVPRSCTTARTATSTLCVGSHRPTVVHSKTGLGTPTPSRTSPTRARWTA